MQNGSFSRIRPYPPLKKTPLSEHDLGSKQFWCYGGQSIHLIDVLWPTTACAFVGSSDRNWMRMRLSKRTGCEDGSLIWTEIKMIQLLMKKIMTNCNTIADEVLKEMH